MFKNTIKGTYPKVLVNTNGNADNCCYPPFSESTEDKESFQGTFSKKIYTWSKANFVPYSYGSENLHQYHGEVILYWFLLMLLVRLS